MKPVFWMSLSPVEINMESSRILVTGLPHGTTKTQLTIYFQSQRDSGGGDVKNIDIDVARKQAVIVFEDVEAATRVIRRRNHRLQNCPIKIEALPGESEVSVSDDDEEVFKDSAYWPDEAQNTNSDLFENHQMGHKRRQSGEESVPSPALNTTTSKRRRSESSPSSQCTVKVTGLQANTSEDLLMNYFENQRRSNGGPVSSVVMKRDLQMCLVTFESPDDAKRIVEHSPHSFSGLCLNVSLLEEPVPEGNAMEVDHEGNRIDEELTDSSAGIAIIASGISPFTPEDAVRNYFENSRRSGGGEVCDIDFNAEEGDAVINFTEVEDLQKLLHGSHYIGGKVIAVSKQPPKRKPPSDSLRVHVRGLNGNTTEDCLLFYLEKFSLDADVKEVTFGDNNSAIATFNTQPDFKTLFAKVHQDEKGLDGNKLRLERVPVCSCVMVTGLNEKTTDDTIQLYFENTRRSGGNIVKHVERKTKDSAIVYFGDPKSVHNVIQKTGHALEEKRLEVKAHFPFFENTATNTTKVPIDSHIFDHIKLNHQKELETLLNRHKVELCNDHVHAVVTLSPSDKAKIPKQLWKERAMHLENFLQSFTKIEIPIAHELFDEISTRWQKQRSTQGASGDQVYFLAHDRLAQIIGKNDTANEERRKLQDLITAAEEDTELMKSVANVVEDGIPRSKLSLLKASGVCESLQSMHQHLKISINVDNETLCLDGPRKILKEVQAEVFKIISKMIERPVELPTNVINVLKMPQVSSVTQDLLKQRSIKAIFVYDQSRSLNEIQVLGVDSQSTIAAERVLLSTIQDKSIQLTNENTQVLDSRRWKNFCATQTSKFKVGIVVDIPSDTVRVSGIAQDVNKCFDEIIQFLEANTILHETLPLDPESTQFVFKRCASKLEDIKRDLYTCSVDVRMTSNLKGIDVSGTNEGLAKCLPRLVSLTEAIRKDSLPIDKPGMKKFFSQDKGSKLLKTIEDTNNCTIITSERNYSETSAARAETDEGGKSSARFICSYLTKQGKKISVFKGDLTSHRVDAIVNAANEELKHVGGLAAAIVKAGGMEIQVSCDKFVQENGRLLEGRAIVTPAGMLPCDTIIHVVGPKWDSHADTARKNGVETQQERVLKFAIRNCLKEAARLKSIALPAVSSGVYGFPRDLCAKVVIDAVLGFCKENPSCMLSEIHLVNNDSATAGVFAEEMRKRFAGENQFEDKENSSLTGLGSHAGGSGGRTLREAPRSITTPQGLRITVKIGDLAKEQADVLVGTAAQNLKLDQNPCAEALRKAAGEGLQRECASQSPLAIGDIAVLQQTGRLSCQAVILAICSSWDSGKGKMILQRLLAKCLKEADRRKLTSVAFAAIGTGTLCFPRDQVSKVYFNEVTSYSQKNPATKVKDVRFVLYDKDTATIHAFYEELKKRLNTTSRSGIGGRSSTVKSSPSTGFLSPVIERKPDHLEANIGSICFKVQPGDITNESTDAIAVITNSQLDLSVGRGAGAKILQLGGDSIRSECSRYPQQNPGAVVVTTAGRLKVRALFHIVPLEPFTAKSMKASIIQCLQDAEKKRITSISFPAVGTGILGMSAKSCAHTMLSAIREFANQQPAHVQLVKMTIFQKDMIKDVRSAMYEASGAKPPSEPGIVQRFATGLKTMAGYIGFGGTEESVSSLMSNTADDSKLHLTIIAGCERDLHQAMKAVNEVMTDNCSKKVIKNEAIKNLSEEHLYKIHTLELRYEVKATVEREVDRIEVCGQPEDILNVYGEILEILHQIKADENERIRAEVLTKDIQWKCRIGDRFEEYDSLVNTQIEVAYSHSKKSVIVIQDGQKYNINFDDMTEKDESGKSTEIKRVDFRKGIQPPDYWVPQRQDHTGREIKVHSVQLHPSTQEYKKVSDLANQSCSMAIVKIERIQNPTLYGLYAIQKQKMDEANGSNEMWLFHGTAGDNCDPINDGGFDRSYSWQKNTLYGKGVYFAKDASYSARSTYSPRDPRTGLRHMYLARVLVGEYTVGKPDILVAPKKNSANPTDTYDSVVDQIPDPSIFVVFRDYRSYPEYLISFK